MATISKYSFLSLLRHGAGQPWARQWRDAEPKAAYDVVIIGAGGHGLATAYYLAKEHGARNVVVLDKGWLGGGNTGRNTTIIRSNYLQPESAALYEHALKRWWIRVGFCAVLWPSLVATAEAGTSSAPVRLVVDAAHVAAGHNAFRG